MRGSIRRGEVRLAASLCVLTKVMMRMPLRHGSARLGTAALLVDAAACGAAADA
jgi:hypothetical protein